MGIVGRNGAGKSTLLKVLSRIVEPTCGYADIHGRVGSLLEVGTGFHPELTGRENTFLNGAILGMKRAEIESKFDEIVEFAEVQKFIDTPVKHYSSGMYLRLAFAVAAHLEPEILLVDEVLAVGDAAFQKKCLGKMGEVAEHGRTVLFVSHNMAAVRSLCHRAVLLQGGEKLMEGTASKVVDRYLQGGMTRSAEAVFADPASAPGNDKARLAAVRILDESGNLADNVDIESSLTLEVEYRVLAPGTVLNVSISLFSQDEVYVLASPSVSDKQWFQRPHPAGHYRSRCALPPAILNAGRYSLSALLVEEGRHVIAQADRIVSVDTIDLGASSGGYFGYWGGVVRPNLPWATERVEEGGAVSKAS
jgi:lipopolysaccharide transport system ATP-binding protein